MTSETSQNNFMPLLETMDLSKLYGLTFIVATSTGDRNDGKLLAKTIHGPFSFEEMVNEVGRKWVDSQDNAKVYILEKDHNTKPKWLDQNTTDYIQFKFVDILTERMLAGAFDVDAEKRFTCEANAVADFNEETL
jgi:hypothetical protein